MRGRKPKPTAQRVLEGNPGKRALNENEPQPPPLFSDNEQSAGAVVAAEDVPEELTDQRWAIKEWNRLAPMLRACRQITEADRGALIALCLEWGRYVEAHAKVKSLGLVVKAPSGYPMTNPYLSIATKALAGCNKLWPELGLTPSSRSRVKTSTPPGADDPFAEFNTPPPRGPMPTQH